MVLFLHTLILPLGWLIANVLYKMQHDGRVIYLEKVLNEAFEIPGYSPGSHEVSKQIYIGPGEIPDEVYIFLDNEPDIPIWLDEEAIWLYTKEELDLRYCDFTIVVPRTLEPKENKLRNLVNFYKLAGKKYKIEYL